jgi:hypothetical protein
MSSIVFSTPKAPSSIRRKNHDWIQALMTDQRFYILAILAAFLIAVGGGSLMQWAGIPSGQVTTTMIEITGFAGLMIMYYRISENNSIKQKEIGEKADTAAELARNVASTLVDTSARQEEVASDLFRSNVRKERKLDSIGATSQDIKRMVNGNTTALLRRLAEKSRLVADIDPKPEHLAEAERDEKAYRDHAAAEGGK